MMHKVGRIASRLTSIISSWPEVDSVLSCEAAETDVLDPYFALVLDVYYDGAIPGRDERQTLYENPGAFETSSSGEKDRFFLEGLPVRVEFKSVRSIDNLIKNQFDSMLLFGSSGTYILYRLVNGNVLYKRSDRVERMRESLNHSPAEFWCRLREVHQQKMEHCLSDLGGAALKDDRFFYFVSLSGFLRAFVSAIFAANKQLEPSDRHMSSALMALPLLPEDLQGRWAQLLQTDGSVDPEKRYQIAQLIARSVFALEQA